MFLAFIAKRSIILALGGCIGLGLCSSLALADKPEMNTPVAEWIRLHIVAINVDAVDVVVNGEKRGVTPAEIKLPRSNTAITMKFEKKGYFSKELRVTPHRTRTIKIRLKKIPPPPKKKDPRENLPF